MTNTILSSALKVTLRSVSNTEEIIGVVTARLASGLKVESAIDDPQNFFTSMALRDTASDYAKLLDGIQQNIRAIEEAGIGLDTIETLLNQGESIAINAKKVIAAGGAVSGIQEELVNTSPASLNSQILADLPDVYYRLNETGGPIVDSGFGGAGPVVANYNSGATPGAAALYTNGGGPSVNFDGVNDRIIVNNSTLINVGTTPARTVELVFNADDITGRQILYEEGGATNGFSIYIDNGLVRVTAEDDAGVNTFADLDISAPIVAGQTYHVAFVFNGAAQTFAGYLDGVLMAPTLSINSDAVFPDHTGGIGIGGMNNAAQFHDGEDSGATGFNFNGRISDVAIYNRPLDESELFSHAQSLNATTTTLFRQEDFENVLNQIDQTVIDANYQGINLLNDEDLRTDFNPDRSNFLITEGIDFTSEGLGLKGYDFNDEGDIDIIIESLRIAQETVRSFARTLASDLSILDTRLEYTKDKVNGHVSGADDLTVADTNKEGASLLALQTRQSLGVTALSLASQSYSSVLRLF